MADEVALLTPTLGLPFFTRHADVALYKKLGFACVHAIGTKRGRPLNVRWSLLPSGRFDCIRSSNHEELVLHDIVWTADGDIAKKLMGEVHRILDKAGRRIRGDWFDVTAELIVPTIQIAIDNTRLPTFTHEGMMERFAAAERGRTAATLKSIGA